MHIHISKPIPPPSSSSDAILQSAKRLLEDAHLVAPGVNVCVAEGVMRGHGTYFEGDELIASVAGSVEQVNKLIQVKPVKSRYLGEIGDVVVGRITEVQQKRWKVDTNSRLDSNLLLASVNLPGGELRRKTLEDELIMREYLKEGDLVSAEVQQLFQDGSLSLHTRNLKYGKLGQGTLVKVPPYLVKRRKTHFHNLQFGASVILGCNGNIWISPVKSEDEALTGGYVQDIEPVAIDTRMVISRLVNCVNLLVRNSIALYDTTIIHAYNTSLKYEIKDLLRPEIADDVAKEVASIRAMEEAESTS